MYHNSFSLRIVGGNEQQSGYVDIAHGQAYSLQMRNDREERCDVRVEIDGQDVGTWRIERRQSINIDRPAHDTGKFTFYRLGSEEGAKVALDSASPDLGLVKVTFMPEMAVKPLYGYGVIECTLSHPSTFTNAVSYGATRSAGGTGLSGESHQRFGAAGQINHDRTQETVIQLRLVCAGETDEPRPLTVHSTPYPPRLE